MKITKEWLEEKEACVEGIEWFCSQKETDAVKLIKKLIRRGDKDSFDWANWSIVRVMTYKQYVSYAVYAAELVIDVYEEDYPDDDRPRKAIEAAKKCINEPTIKNKKAALAAWSAVDASWLAARAALASDDAMAAEAAGMAARAARAELAALSAGDAMVADVAVEVVWAVKAVLAKLAALLTGDARAADVAVNAAWAALAAWAAEDARAAGKETLLKILKHGLKILEAKRPA